MEKCMDRREVMLKHGSEGVNSRASKNARVQILREVQRPLIIEQDNGFPDIQQMKQLNPFR